MACSEGISLRPDASVFTFSKAQTAWRGRASVKPSPLALELQHLPTNIVAIPPVFRIPKETFNSLAPHESEKVLAARARLGARCIGLELF